MQNFDILWGGKGDHWESENRTLNENWTLFNGRNKHFPRHVPAFDIASDIGHFLLFLPKHV